MLKKTTITYTHPWGDELYRFENVPALVCTQSGEVWFTAEVARLMDEIIRKRRKPKKFHKVPVYSLSELTARPA